MTDQYDDEPADLTLRQLRAFRAELAAHKDELARFKAWQEAEVETLHREIADLQANLRQVPHQRKVFGGFHHLRREIDGIKDRLERATTAA